MFSTDHSHIGSTKALLQCLHVPRYIICNHSYTYGKMNLCSLARQVAHMVQISRSHMSHSTTSMLQHKVRPEFKLNVIRFTNNFNQSYSPYTIIVHHIPLSCVPVLHTHLCCEGTYVSLQKLYIQQSWFSRKKCKTCLQQSDIATDKVHRRQRAFIHIHLRLAGTNDAAICNYLRLHRSK